MTNSSEEIVSLMECIGDADCFAGHSGMIVTSLILYFACVVVVLLFCVTSAPVIYAQMKKKDKPEEWMISWSRIEAAQNLQEEQRQRGATRLRTAQLAGTKETNVAGARTGSFNLAAIGKSTTVKDKRQNRANFLIFEGKQTILKNTYVPYGNMKKNPQMISELSELYMVNNKNISNFYGVTDRSGITVTLQEYFLKGSLFEALKNKSIAINQVYEIYWINEIIDGLNYLQNYTSIKSHGNLNTRNCMLTSHMSLKITGFGAPTLRKLKKQSRPVDSENIKVIQKLWTAPELLRMADPPMEGTQKGDIYSLAILVHELVVKKGAFGETGKPSTSVISVIEKVKAVTDKPFRPSIPDDETVPEDLKVLMERCWEEKPQLRPTCKHIKTKYLHKLQSLTLGASLMDYSTIPFNWKMKEIDEKAQPDSCKPDSIRNRMAELIEQVIPMEILDEFCGISPRLPHQYGSVSIMFMDIKNFTVISDKLDPYDVAALLNSLFDEIDRIVDRHQFCRKVETIGDAYMVASGLPKEYAKHSSQVCRLACEIQQFLSRFRTKQKALETIGKVEMRCGVHSGKAASGLVGLSCPRWVILGETVKIAEELEKGGQPGRVHVSEATKKELASCGSLQAFRLERRLNEAGKEDGIMWEEELIPTYWLTQEKLIFV